MSYTSKSYTENGNLTRGEYGDIPRPQPGRYVGDVPGSYDGWLPIEQARQETGQADLEPTGFVVWDSTFGYMNWPTVDVETEPPQ